MDCNKELNDKCAGAEAKEIFIQYDGNYYEMFRDDVLCKYKDYKVSEKVEQLWFEESIRNVCLKIENTSNKRELVGFFEKLGTLIFQSKQTDSVQFHFPRFHT